MNNIILLVLIFAFTFIILIFISPIRIKFVYIRKDKKKYRLNIIWLWNIIDLPVPLKLLWHIKQRDRKNLNREPGENAAPPKNLKALLKYYKRRIPQLKKLINYFLQNTLCQELKFSTRFGTNDAANTGIIFGALWIIMGSLLFLIQNNCTFASARRPEINIYPQFNYTGFELYFTLELEYRQTIKLIFLVLYAIKVILPIGGEIRRWRIIQSKV